MGLRCAKVKFFIVKRTYLDSDVVPFLSPFSVDFLKKDLSRKVHYLLMLNTLLVLGSKLKKKKTSLHGRVVCNLFNFDNYIRDRALCHFRAVFLLQLNPKNLVYCFTVMRRVADYRVIF